VRGYDDKLGVLLSRVLQKLVSLEMEEPRFEVLKETHERGLKNWAQEQPYAHAVYYVNYLLKEKRFSKQELLDTMPCE